MIIQDRRSTTIDDSSGDGLYHPRAFNDRLVLGLKGVERHSGWGWERPLATLTVRTYPCASTVPLP